MRHFFLSKLCLLAFRQYVYGLGGVYELLILQQIVLYYVYRYVRLHTLMYVQWVDSIVLSIPPTPSSLGWSISFHFLLGSRAFCHKPLREEQYCYGLSCSGKEKTIIKFYKPIFLATPNSNLCVYALQAALMGVVPGIIMYQSSRDIYHLCRW